MWESPKILVVEMEQSENNVVASLGSSCIVIIPNNQIACDHIACC